ncbi:type VII secretion protein EccCa [Actinocorallia populi]|uniref:type VII secretion protein EccCa n=1 Tax=Actinocorallia populi TaxID=2079200 RepID=UPI002FCDC850
MPRGEILLESPPEIPEQVSEGGRQALMYLPMMAGSGAMILMVAQPGSSPLTWVASGLFAVSMLGMMVGQLGRGSGERKVKLNAERRDYLRYLGQVRTKVRTAAKEQRDALEWGSPDPAALPTLVMSDRLWERRTTDDDFVNVRIARGPQRLALELIPPDSKPVEDLEPMTAGALGRFTRTHSTVPDLPVAVALRSFARVVPGGDPRTAHGLTRAMLLHLAAFHTPDDVRISVCASPERLAAWDWVKWLPHALHPTELDAAGPARLITTGLGDLEKMLEIQNRPRFGRGLSLDDLPYHVVVLDGGQVPYDTQLAEGIEGVTVLDLAETLPPVSDDLTLRLRAAPRQMAMITRDHTGREAATRIGVPDQVSIPQAEALARQLAPLRASAAEEAGEDALAGATTLTQLFGITDPRRVDLASSWRPRPPRSRLRVPVGVDPSGRPVELDIKEAAQGGFGPHGLCIGATGAGKSEFLRTLVLGLAMTHSSEVLNFVLVDFKGGATFLGMDGLHHVSAVITNLEDELPLVDRMYDALHGEMVRRQELLRAAGNYASLRDYEKAREQGVDLKPMPTLFLVLDEFSELLSAKPEFAELFVMIGRLGRSLGVHLLLASQRLEEGKLRGLDTHLSYRIGLRTFSAMESRVVLGVPDAYELPQAPGHGYLKVGTEQMTRFRAAYVSGPVSEEVAAASGMQDSSGQARRIVPYTATPAPLAAQERQEPAQQEPERKESQETLFDAVVKQMNGLGPAAHQIWLPPLAEPPTLDGLIPRDGGRRPLHTVVGIVDRPFDQRRDPFWLDLSGAAGHVGVAGAPRSGKSTALRTLICSLALQHTPREVQFYCLDFGGGSLAQLAGLPHVGGVASRLDADRVRRTVAEVTTLLDQRERRFAELGVDSMDSYRRRRAAGEFADDPFGDVFLVVDGWLTLRQDYEALEEAVTELASRGLGYGVHVVAATHKWSEFRMSIRDLFGTRLELRLGDPYESEVDRRLAANVPEDAPGRGLTREGLHFLTALPRVDGVQNADDLAEGVPDLVNRLAGSWQGPGAPKVRLLPSLLSVEEMPKDGGKKIPIGIDEDSLSPVMLDFTADPHFLVFGDTECGKSNLMRLIVEGITGRFTPAEARLIFLDYRRSMLEEAGTEHQIGYAASSTAAEPLLKGIHGALINRLPPADLTPVQLKERSWWSGADLFVVIDDYELVATSNNPLSPIVELLPQARDIGLHIILARAGGGAGRAMYDPVVQRIREMSSPGLIMSGSKDEGALLGNVRAEALPPGRGRLVDRRAGVRLIQTAYRGG